VAVKLRLTRLGRKKRPFYRIVAIDSRKRRDGSYIEKVGHYDPITQPANLLIDHDVALKWLNYGAVVSDTVRSLFKRDGVLLRWDMSKRDYEQVKIEEAVTAHREIRMAKLVASEKPAPVKAEPKKAEAKPEAKPVVKPEAKKEEPKQEAAKAEKPEADKE
jgi:small subunit ribosomal protein S16